MKFAHIADCHIGGWRDQKMRDVSINSFVKCIDEIIEEKVHFLLISGDLFNNSHPNIDSMKTVVRCLKKLKNSFINVYAICGSHDYSPSGKTIIDVLEEAGLLINVVKGSIVEEKLRLKFTYDDKSDVKITGMLGKRGMLDKHYYKDLDRKYLEDVTGFKIFMFHTSIEELKPESLKEMSGEPVSILPKGFHYYAGGHVHIIENQSFEKHKNVIYPGPTYPNNFKELWDLECGSYVIFDEYEIETRKINSKEVLKFEIDAKAMISDQVEEELNKFVLENDFDDKIVMIRVFGKLKDSKVSDINFSKIVKEIYLKNAYFVMRNTSALKGMDFEEVQIQDDTIENIEMNIINENIDQLKHKNVLVSKEDFVSLMQIMSNSKNEGEKNFDYEKKILNEINSILDLK